MCDFRHVTLFDHLSRVEGLKLLGALMGFKVVPPTAAGLFSYSCFYFLSMCVPRVPIQHRITPGITGDYAPESLVVRVFQKTK